MYLFMSNQFLFQVVLHYLSKIGARKQFENYLSSSLVVFHKLNIAVGGETCLQSKHNCCIFYLLSYDSLAVNICNFPCLYPYVLFNLFLYLRLVAVV